MDDAKALSDLLAKIDEIDGGTGGDVEVMPAPTGITSFDASTGIGGFPRNRISILQGEEHSGKTLMVLKTIAHAQSQGGRCAFIDAEHALTPNFAKLLGVNWEELAPFVRRPTTLDAAYDLLRELSSSGLFDVVGFDSTTALTTRAAIGVAAGEAGSRAAVARMHSEELPKVVATLHAKTAVLFVNQMRENPNPPNWWKGGKMLYAPGGKALRHYASLIVETKPGQVYKKADVRIGHRLKTHIVKNKVGVPYLTSEFDLMYKSGLDLTSDMVETAIAVGAIRQSGSWFYLPMIDLETGESLGEDKRFAGRAALEDAIKADDNLVEYIRVLISQAEAAE